MTCMQVGTKLFNLREPFTHDYDLRDAVKAISQICRFQGQSNGFYSVAQHCVVVSTLLDNTTPWDGLAHDLAEAYTGDLISPWKQLIREEAPNLWARIRTIEQAVENAFLFDGHHSEVKRGDLLALATERRDLIPAAPGLDDHWPDIDPIDYQIKPLTPVQAEKAWWARYKQLLARKKAPKPEAMGTFTRSVP